MGDQTITRFHNPDGPDISTTSGRVIERDGLFFKDADGSGQLVPYADWRLDPTDRARDLAGRMTIDQIAGLMLYSPHQMVPGAPGAHFPATYDGAEYSPDLDPATLSDQQRDLLLRDDIRHVLVITYADVDTAVRWHNAMQALAESQPLGIPVNFSTDPRHGASEGWGAEFRGQGVAVSKWPEGLGMAATFDLDAVRQMADAVRQEYRALGLATALGPQIDLATEPRWMRAIDTFGGNVEQVVEIARAYIDGLQTTPGAASGWGNRSVIAMAKHWPGGGTGEGGRDAHYWFGMYNVYPGDNFEQHLRPFTEGAFDLPGPTGQAGAIMPYYSVSVGHSGAEAVGNSYSEHLIKDLLRGEFGYDGVVCTDWGITDDASDDYNVFQSRCFGVRDLSVAERHLRIILNGADQFGGNSDAAPVIEAYRLGVERFGEQVMRARFEQSAVRLLRGMFRVGLFDDPYLDADESRRVVANEEFVRAGYAAQLASVVPLKLLPAEPAPEPTPAEPTPESTPAEPTPESTPAEPTPESTPAEPTPESTPAEPTPESTPAERAQRVEASIPRGSNVWIPRRHRDEAKGFFLLPMPAADFDALLPDVVAEYFTVVDSPEDADAALVVMSSPVCDPYVDNEYRPISLQYRPYDAPTAREHSLASGDDGDRSYRGRSAKVSNAADLDNLEAARAAMGSKPVVAVVQLDTPVIMGEIEPLADALFVHFGVSHRAILDVVSGSEPAGGRLPYRLPASMAAIEAHSEDRFGDFPAYIDGRGNAYDTGFSAVR